jgi:hypothetical protein
MTAFGPSPLSMKTAGPAPCYTGARLGRHETKSGISWAACQAANSQGAVEYFSSLLTRCWRGLDSKGAGFISRSLPIIGAVPSRYLRGRVRMTVAATRKSLKAFGTISGRGRSTPAPRLHSRISASSGLPPARMPPPGRNRRPALPETNANLFPTRG